ARIERLPPEARRLLRGASVFGETFWRGGVHALMGNADPTHVGEWIRHLLDAEIIAARSSASYPGEDEYIFRHALLREAAYRMLTEADRALGHRLAGEWLESIGATNAAALAEHFERGLVPERAIEWYARGAEDALAGNEYEAVQLRGERALLCGASGETLGRIRMLQADASRWSGRYERSIEQAREAMSHLAPATPNWFEAAGTLAIVCSLVGSRGELVAVTQELNAVALTTESVDSAVVALARATSSAARLGMGELGNETLRRMDDVAAGSHPGDPAVAARLHYSRASVADINRDVSRSIRENLAASEAYEAAGMLRNLAVHRRLVAEAWMQIGQNAIAETELRRSIADSERLGLRENMCFSQHLLAVVLARRGLKDEAVSLGRAAVADSQDHGGRNESHARCSLAAILLGAGELAAAHEESRRAVAVAPASAPMLAFVHATFASTALAMGMLDEARVASRAAMEIYRAGVGPRECELFVRLVELRVLERDRSPELSARIEEAKRELLTRAEHFTDAAQRESFLTNVQENVAILAFGKP
ncbi:MAG: hypothetical protein ABI175_20115, partial [Polyangiales bacterium]